VNFQPKISEAQFQRNVIHAARLYGWIVDHTPPMRNHSGDIYTGGLTGKTDLVLFSMFGRGIIFAELKTETGRVSPAQKRFAEIIQLNGGEYFLWRPSDMESILERLRR
jgi:hypothetical protein